MSLRHAFRPAGLTGLPAAIVFAFVLLSGCGRDDGAPLADPIEPGPDPHSHAEFERVRIGHMHLDLDADFNRRRLSGHVILELDRIDPAHQRLVLDTRDLNIRDINAVAGNGTLSPLSWRLGEAHAYLGAPLVIALPEGVETLRIDYDSSPDAFGLQWLDAEQTRSGRPFLFSQSQPHYARTWIPLQDTPAVRYTYSATVRAPRGLMAVMGAGGNPRETATDGVYRFDMPEPIPAYLMAIAIGTLEFAEIGARTGVYAEPYLIEAAAREFAQLEEMVAIGEALYGPYRWGRYDLLVLPASFPFGGMENPRLSYITPTIIAGDRSLLALVAHELAHSWSGNLVTNAAWGDVWLNEGFTVYVEARIMEVLYNRARRDMEAVLGYRGLLADLEDADPEDRQLVLELAGTDPERAFTRIPYQMGRLFLDWLEHRFGRERFDDFLRGYFEHFAFESLSSENFRDYLEAELVAVNPGRVSMAEVDQWLYEPGLPESAVLPESEAFARVDQWRERWLNGEAALEELPAGEWSVHEWRHFLIGLEGRLDRDRMAALDQAFELTAEGNYEILFLWLMRAIESAYEPARARLERFLLEVGRMKFTTPLYEALYASEWGRDWALEVYERARPGYHALTRQRAERALGLE